MRKKIAAANWKMNLTYEQAIALLDELTAQPYELGAESEVIIAVPFPYLEMASSRVSEIPKFSIAAQNCSEHKSGAYTGEVSTQMIASMGVGYCVVGHSERRQYFHESNEQLAQKVDRCLENDIIPIFCCGEPLEVREAGNQNQLVAEQIGQSLFHLDDANIRKVVIAYEPIWAIGTGKTASSAQAQEMHAQIRQVLAGKYGQETADSISILYGGSVKASNAVELFSSPDVDGGLVGGASLQAAEFAQIIKGLDQ